MTAYIYYEDTPTIDLAAAKYGFKEIGYKIVTFDDISDVPASAGVVVGYIDDLQAYFEKLGIGKQRAINISEELGKEEFLKRTIEFYDMKTFKALINLPIFIKPARYPKEFMAGVMKAESSKLFYNDVPDDTPVLISEVVDMISEYRCYVIKGKLVGIKNYQGDIRVFPDVKMIDRMIAAYTKAPAGYSVDVAILASGETVLVEVQDGWALGNYGLECDVYARLLAARWTQLKRSI